MRLSRRVESLEERMGLKAGFHVIFTAEGESQQEAKRRYCCENSIRFEQLNDVFYISPEDAKVL